MQEAHLQILSCRAMAGGFADTIARACVHECPCDGVRTVDIRGSVWNHLSVRTNSSSFKLQTLRNDLVSRALGSLSEPHRFTARAAGCVGRLSCLQRVPLTSYIAGPGGRPVQACLLGPSRQGGLPCWKTYAIAALSPREVLAGKGLQHQSSVQLDRLRKPRSGKTA
jgi:hypothetical protein